MYPHENQLRLVWLPRVPLNTLPEIRLTTTYHPKIPIDYEQFLFRLVDESSKTSFTFLSVLFSCYTQQTIREIRTTRS